MMSKDIEVTGNTKNYDRVSSICMNSDVELDNFVKEMQEHNNRVQNYNFDNRKPLSMYCP